MGKIKIYPTDAIQIKRDGVYVDYDGSEIEVGNTFPINVELKVDYSKYCNGSTCEYDMFGDGATALTAAQLDAIYRSYSVTYIDNNLCESSGDFAMLNHVFTRPIDEVNSDHPKQLRKPTTGWDYWWDTDSEFAVKAGRTCQGIANGFAPQTGTSNGSTIEFWTMDTSRMNEEQWNTATPRQIIGNIPYRQVTVGGSEQWVKLSKINDMGRDTCATDLFGTPISGNNQCYGYMRVTGEASCVDGFYLPQRKGGGVYSGTGYSDSSGPSYRYGKIVFKLDDSTDAYNSVRDELIRLINQPGSTFTGTTEGKPNDLDKCSYLYEITSSNDETFTATAYAHSSGYDPRNLGLPSTITGKTVHFTSPVAVYIYQPNTAYTGEPQYTYTVTTNEGGIGATVHWTGATPVVDTRALGGTNTINSLGYAKAKNTDGGAVDIYIEKSNTSFEYNGRFSLTKDNPTVEIKATSTPVPPTPTDDCSMLNITLPGSTFTYTVNSNVNGATVEFWAGSTLLKSGSISSGSYSATLTVSSVTAKISKSNCSFSPSSTAMTNGGTATLNGTCGTPTTSCSDGSTNGLGSSSCVSNTVTTSKVWVGTWWKSPSGCDQTWSLDGSRSVSGTGFINTGSLEFRSDGNIYGLVSAANTGSLRECKIPTKLGSIKQDYFTVYQCAYVPPTPTNYTYTVTSNTVGAIVSLWNNGTQVGSTGSIGSNGKFTLTSTINATLDIVIYKTGCTFPSGKTVAPNGTTGVNGTCNTCNTCADVGIGNLTGYSFDANEHLGARIASFTANCNPTFRISYFQGYDIARSWTVSNTGGNNYSVFANVSANTNTYAKEEILILYFNDSSGNMQNCAQFTIRQAASTPDPCLSEALPTLNIGSFSHIAGSRDTYTATMSTSSCWRISSTDESNPSIMTSTNTNNTVTVTCEAGEPGDSANVTVNFTRAADGGTGSRVISAMWICPDCPNPNPSTIKPSHTSGVVMPCTINNSCWFVYDLSINQNPPSYGFVSATYSSGADYDTVLVTCRGNQQAGYRATITVYLRSKDGLNRKTTKTINVTYV